MSVGIEIAEMVRNEVAQLVERVPGVEGLVGNAVVYGRLASMRTAKYSFATEIPTNLFYEPPEEEARTEALACRLGSTPAGSGEDQFLCGIHVDFDLTFTNKAWVEMERYRFVTFVQSQSTMHRMGKFGDDIYDEHVDPRIVETMRELRETYNRTHDPKDFLRLVYSNPAGCRITARLTTNYRALKTVYNQRKGHRLPEWRRFCEWIHDLPGFARMCLGEKE